MSSNNRYNSRTDVFIKLILVFFVSLLSFSVGTYVGKKFSDNQHKLSKYEPSQEGGSEVEGELGSTGSESGEALLSDAHMDSSSMDSDRGESGVGVTGSKSIEKSEGLEKSEGRELSVPSGTSKGAQHKGGKGKDELSDDEIAKLAEEFITDDHLKGVSKGGHKKDFYRGPSSVVVEEKKGEGKIPLGERENISESSSEKVNSDHSEGHLEKLDLSQKMINSSVGKYTVQVGSYPREEEAQTAASGLKKQGFSAFYVAARIRNTKLKTEKTWYRVSVGLFTTQQDAEAYRKDLINRSKVSSAIIQKISSEASSASLSSSTPRSSVRSPAPASVHSGRAAGAPL